MAESVSKRVSIDELYLDPNNYRFADNSKYVKVSETDIKKDDVQRRTRKFIEGDKRENIKDLLSSIRNNGYLNVDIIQLKPLDGGGYLVIEGNRRTVALKCLYDDLKNGIDIGELDESLFESIPAEVYSGTDESKRMIIMGLKHISGNKKWAPINQSRMIYDYLKQYELGTPEYNEHERELVGSLGISLNKLRNGQRAYHFARQYMNSDYGEQFSSDKYSFFEEAMRRPAIRNWLGWSEETYKCTDRVNEERFFTWISSVEERVESENGTDGSEYRDDNYVEDEVLEPIITKSVEIRDLAAFIDDPEKIALMESKRSIYAVLRDTSVTTRESIESAVTEVDKNLNMILRYTDALEDSDYEALTRISDRLISLIPANNVLNRGKVNYEIKYNIDGIGHFGSLYLKNYKKFRNISLEKLNRINIFVGPNNSGKSTVLEAIYLLCHQNDINGLVDLSEMRLKGDDITTEYLDSLIDYRIEIEGVFDKSRVSVDIRKLQDSKVEKKDDYISSLWFSGQIAELHSDDKYDLIMHMYEKNPIEKVYDRIGHICRIGYSSPYYPGKRILAELYDNAIRMKINGHTYLERIMDFVRTNVDSSINTISMGKDGRFIVDSSRFNEKNVELSSYGEGIERIFQISLYVAYCRNGVLLIDEFETAIHFSLLKKISLFLQELSVAFNTQVFLTTHSKECVDAFVENDFKNSELMFYQLDMQNTAVKEISGIDLRRLLDSFNTDIRGIQ